MSKSNKRRTPPLVACPCCNRMRIRWQKKHFSSVCRRCFQEQAGECVFPLRHAGMPLPRPTDVPPGPERVDVLAERVRLCQQLWHPDDATRCLT